MVIRKTFLVVLILALSTAPAASNAKTITTQDNPESRGKAAFVDRERGHCLLCHQVKQINESFQGNIGPDLSNIGARLDEKCEQLGLIVRPIINMCVFSPPLIINRPQIDEMMDILDEAIRQVGSEVMA